MSEHLGNDISGLKTDHRSVLCAWALSLGGTELSYRFHLAPGWNIILHVSDMASSLPTWRSCCHCPMLALGSSLAVGREEQSMSARGIRCQTRILGSEAGPASPAFLGFSNSLPDLDLGVMPFDTHPELLV